MEDRLKSVLLRRKKPEMVQFLNDNPGYFDEAMELAVNNEPTFSWRAAWVICGIIKKNDIRVKPHILNILSKIPELEDGHQRELLKILLKMDLDEGYESILFDLAVNLWEKVRKKSSVRHVAFSCMIKVAEKYPELKHEVLILTESHYLNSLSPGIRKSILKRIESLKKCH